MTNTNHIIRRVAVLGAGVMGAQIAAHLINARVPVILFDLPAKDGDKNGIVNRAIANLGKLKPAPLALAEDAKLLIAANYEDGLAELDTCDLIIEAIAERLDWKEALYAQVAPHINDKAIFATNTSGLSINTLAQGLPETLKNKFCGIHFFNPPRYMRLVEIIPCDTTDTVLLEPLETFVTTQLGKGVVFAKDTPNFVANRVGVFSMLATMHHADALNIPFDIVDQLTGRAIGRPKSATYRTADVVGLDTLAHVVKTMTDNLMTDPWFELYALPDWLQTLISHGNLGQKTGAGVFRKHGKDIQQFDIESNDYVATGNTVDAEVTSILAEKDWKIRLQKLRSAESLQAQFLWRCFRDVFHYCAVHLNDIAHSARDIDFALRWGFGWDQGPFEIWQAANWQQIAVWLQEDIQNERTLGNAPLPDWVLADNRKGVHSDDGSYAPESAMNIARPNTPVYQRQLFPQALYGESPQKLPEVFREGSVSLSAANDEIGVLSIHSKMNTLGNDVVEPLQAAVQEAENRFTGLVIWQPRPPFSVGANLSSFDNYWKDGDIKQVEQFIQAFQDMTMAVKYSALPVVAAMRGMALGGGCELMMHCDKVVAHIESYIGLVEMGVGLIPGGGGLKELAVRAVSRATHIDPFTDLTHAFEQVAMAKVSGSAREAQKMGFLRDSDTIIMHEDELLYVAIQQANALAASGYRPPLRHRTVDAIGRDVCATVQTQIANLQAGGFATAHDARIATSVATVLCGGDVPAGTPITEDWLLKLEREHFCALVEESLTKDRILHMLKTGKPLRN